MYLQKKNDQNEIELKREIKVNTKKVHLCLSVFEMAKKLYFYFRKNKAKNTMQNH